jgi:hypothetical protein
MIPEPLPEPTKPEGYAYFALRLIRDTDRLTGILEHLGTHEKAGFSRPEELTALLERWSAGRRTPKARANDHEDSHPALEK